MRFAALMLGMSSGCLAPLTTLTPITQQTGQVQTVSAGARHACALLEDGSLKCWGAPGLVGDGTRSLRVSPVDVVGDGTLEITAGIGHTCALSTRGSVSCWGINGRGELGLGTNEPALSPTLVASLGESVTHIAAGGSHTCALSDTGHVRCWGVNDQFQLGAGVAAETSTPVLVADLANGIRDVSAGAGHTCVAVATGEIHCWGGNAHGELGIGTASSTPVAKPQRVLGLPEPMMMVRSGFAHTCAVSAAGEVLCWGQGSAGALGDDTSLDRVSPVAVKGLPAAAVDLTAGEDGTCAVLANAETYCWGDNSNGQLGDGTRIGRSAPVLVEGLRGRAISSGRAFACAATSEHRAYCWGRNDEGQLGDGTSATRELAGPVMGL